jgi:hypothetical protein
MERETYFRPNSMRVSFKNSPGFNLPASAFVIVTLPGASGGKTRMLDDVNASELVE